MTVAHITGARPNFPKAAPVINALARRGVTQQLVHTGQHYDDELSEMFFRDLNLPRPDINLGVGSGSHGRQTAAVMIGLEELFEAQRPALVLVYGDVNSTVAAALVAAKMGIAVGHVEAGLRSFDDTMPEELNRRITDQLSTLLFATSPDAVAHLGAERIAAQRIHFVGNPMIDTLLEHLDRLDPSAYRERHRLDGPYLVATVHRPGNVDGPASATRLVTALHACADQFPILLPLHPRGRRGLEAAGLLAHERLKVVAPLGYVEFLSLVRGAVAVLTDSGAIQEETTVLGVPCLTLRPNTERPITITHGSNQLVEPETVAVALAHLAANRPHRKADGWPVPPLWDGRAGERIASVVATWLRDRSVTR